MDYPKALRKPFTDATKLIIGIFLNSIPFLQWFSIGYIMECSGLGKNKPSRNMPEWKQWGDFFLKGVVGWVIAIIYFIPALLVASIGAFNIVMALMNTFIGKIIPAGMLENVATGSVPPEALTAIIQDNWTQAIPILMRAAPILFVTGILALVAAYFIPVAMLRYLKKNNISAAFEKKVWHNALNVKYFISWIIMAVISTVLLALLDWIRFFGAGAAGFIAGVIGFTLIGNAISKQAK